MDAEGDVETSWKEGVRQSEGVGVRENARQHANFDSVSCHLTLRRVSSAVPMIYIMVATTIGTCS